MSGGHSRPHPQSSFVMPWMVTQRSSRAGPSPRPPWVGRLHRLCPRCFCTPVMQLLPAYMSCRVSASPAPPRPLLPLFPSMMPPSRCESPSPAPVIMGPLPPPHLLSLPASQTPAPIAGNCLYIASSVNTRPHVHRPSVPRRGPVAGHAFF